MSCPSSDRALIARLAAHESWAKAANRSARTAPARAALVSKFEREVDPNGVLPPAERARRAEHARKAHFTRLALRSAQARRKVAEESRGTGSAPIATVTDPLDEYVRRVVGGLPPLTDEQCARVADLLLTG
ncbi:hypothetical protein [Modestobacter marinus]|uniref:hypothetical protein n=1 Tax=Modestobacter marinus TaxID=477641 RepID=UPI001C9594D6|nr:hypothetical protein [Modestobacter marinus]